MNKRTKKKQQQERPIVVDCGSIWHNLDNLHFNWDDTFSYNKPWNITVCEREAGKTLDSLVKIYNAFYYHGCPSIILRRRIADMTSAYLDDLGSAINKFLKDEYKIQLLY